MKKLLVLIVAGFLLTAGTPFVNAALDVTPVLAGNSAGDEGKASDIYAKTITTVATRIDTDVNSDLGGYNRVEINIQNQGTTDVYIVFKAAGVATAAIKVEAGKLLTLSAGQKISDDEEILNIAQKTVPVGYEVVVDVRIRVREIREV